MKNALFFLFFIFLYPLLTAQTGIDYGFKSQNLLLNTPEGEIYGTLTIPETSKSGPVVLIVPGAGATDRDGNSPGTRVNNNCYKFLAEEFARKGIASLRYDKMGIGKSMRKKAGPVLLLHNYIDDATAWIHYLKQASNYTNIIVLGHGEGSLVGMIAARKAGADAFISAEGAGMRYDKVLMYSLKDAPKPMQKEAGILLDKLITDIRIDTVSPSLSAVLGFEVQPFVKSLLSYDPAVEFSKLQVPALIIHGYYDLFVPVNNAEMLAKAKPDAKLKVVKNMNYILKDADEDENYNQLTYFKPYIPLNIEATTAMVNFIKSLP